MALRNRVLNSYINLLRTEKRVFNQDLKTLNNVLHQTRQQYRENQLVTDEKKIEELVEHANAVSNFLLTNLVQAVRKSETRFELKFHKDTDLNHTYEFIGDQKIRKKRGKIALDESQEEQSQCCGGGACGTNTNISQKCS
ncbi:LYR motif-containing protein 7 [Tieghemostelium lacteum]|uniref:LYR motif-containing protein 7 n=1 Tax=Tieghemostelium lacteum TaxID=361077 RepID=A0A152A8K0_TIELA|nr:LYR motif-containing protein 7 [Tieghemostelium lacteum]|eukprot:KYR02543.1 LYR motif-containing protein 7 [Tieghemostelium lacteum]